MLFEILGAMGQLRAAGSRAGNPFMERDLITAITSLTKLEEDILNEGQAPSAYGTTLKTDAHRLEMD